MKIITFILLALIFVSCHSVKKTVAVKETQKQEITQTQAAKEQAAAKVENDVVAVTKTKTTTVKYYPPEEPNDPQTPKASQQEPEKTPGAKPGDKPKPGAVMEVTQTETTTTTEDKSRAEQTRAAESQGAINQSQSRETQTKQAEIPKDPYKWRYILGIIIIFVALGVFIYLKRAKTKAK